MITQQFWNDYKTTIIIIGIILLIICGQILLIHDMSRTVENLINLKNESLDTQEQLIIASDGMKQIHEIYIADDTQIKDEYYNIVFESN